MTTLTALLASRGITPDSRTSTGRTDRSAVHQAALLAPSIDELHDVIGRLEVEPTYDPWFRVIVAIKGAAGAEHDDDGRELAMEYSVLDPVEGAEKYDSISRPVALGWPYLLDVLREQDAAAAAQFEFGVITDQPSNPALATSSPTAETSDIQQANEEFALVVTRPRMVHWRRPEKDAVLVPIDHWRTLMKAREPRGQKAFAEWWLTNPDRLLLEDIVIEPDLPPLAVVDNTNGPVFNQWPGFATRPSTEGSDDLIVAYIRDVVCGGNLEYFEWLMEWLAGMVQEPARLPGTAVVLRGGVGVGKTTLTDIMRMLVGPRLSLVDDKPGRLVGVFNASLEGKVLVGAEEAFFAGDRSTYGALKNLVTAGTLTVEEKHEKARPVRNMAHIIMTTNEHWAVPASESERRFTVLDVSAARQSDRTYFGAMRAQLEQGGADRFMYRLRHEVRVDWSLIARPLRTEALLDQQLDSMDGLRRWWIERLRTGFLPGGGSSPRAEDVYNSIRGSLGDKYEATRATQTKIGRFLQKLGAKKQRSGSGDRAYHYVFPALSEARAAFAAGLATTPEWDDVAEWQEGPDPLVP
jgi:hypothetical protein